MVDSIFIEVSLYAVIRHGAFSPCQLGRKALYSSKYDVWQNCMVCIVQKVKLNGLYDSFYSGIYESIDLFIIINTNRSYRYYNVVSLQVFQEEFGAIKSYNLKPNGDKVPVTNQNRKGTLKIQ